MLAQPTADATPMVQIISMIEQKQGNKSEQNVTSLAMQVTLVAQH